MHHILASMYPSYCWDCFVFLFDCCSGWLYSDLSTYQPTNPQSIHQYTSQSIYLFVYFLPSVLPSFRFSVFPFPFPFPSFFFLLSFLHSFFIFFYFFSFIFLFRNIFFFFFLPSFFFFFLLSCCCIYQPICRPDARWYRHD